MVPMQFLLGNHRRLVGIVKFVVSSFITPKAAHNTKNAQNTVTIHVEPINVKT